MPIAFDAGRWSRVKENAERWWNGELGRPLIQYTLYGARDPGRPKPARKREHFFPFHPPATTADGMLDPIDHDLCGEEYLGDAFPNFWVNFGPGVLAAFLGGTVKPLPASPSVWFGPPESGMRELADYPDWTIDASGYWFERVASVFRAAAERWEGAVQVGMTDLGGVLDVISSFRPDEGLLYDLYDCPDEVLRRVDQVYAAWWEAFDRLDALIRPVNPGYTAWLPIFANQPFYMLQCDFSYMISPDHFRRFARPELAASSRRLGRPFYHLDGVGELPHLDMLLAIPELAGVQWVPGGGKPGHAHWPDVFRRIRDAGKRIWITGDFAAFDAVVEQLGGDASPLVYIAGGPAAERASAEAFLEKYGAR